MLESQPSSSPGVAFGYSLMIGLVLLDAVWFLLLVRGPITLLSFLWGLLLLLSLPLLGLLGYWTASLGTARYHVADQALLLEWGGLRQVVPLAAIQSLKSGREVTAVTRFRGLRWPGLMVGRGQLGEQEAVFLATRPLAEQLLLVTETAVYAISPIDLENFKDCLEALRQAEPDESAEWPDTYLGFLQWRFWEDRLAQLLLAAAGLLNVVLFAYLTAVNNHLPSQVPLHFDRLGEVDRLAAPGRLLVLPLIGLLAWIINGLLGSFFYQQEQRVPAYLLWGTAVVVQLAIWGAVLGLLN